MIAPLSPLEPEGSHGLSLDFPDHNAHITMAHCTTQSTVLPQRLPALSNYTAIRHAILLQCSLRCQARPLAEREGSQQKPGRGDILTDAMVTHRLCFVMGRSSGEAIDSDVTIAHSSVWERPLPAPRRHDYARRCAELAESPISCPAKYGIGKEGPWPSKT